jgi:hypothetical protein
LYQQLQPAACCLHAAILAPELPAALEQHPREAATLLEAAFRTAMAAQELSQSSITALAALNWLDIACRIPQRLQEEYRAVCQAEPAAATQLFGLAASVLKSADVLCSSSFASRLSSSSSSSSRSSSKLLVCMSITKSNIAVHAVAQEGFPATLQLLLHARLLSVVGKVGSLSSSAAWGEQLAPATSAYAWLRAVLLSADKCTRLLGELQLPGETTAAADATRQLQQQASVLTGILQQQLQVLEQAGDAELVQAAAAAASPAAAVVGQLQQQQQQAELAEAQEQNRQTAAARVSETAVNEAAQAAAVAAQPEAAGLEGSSCTDISLQQQIVRVFPGDLAQQLQQFGEAVCHQLPVSMWCCNPRCSNLQQQSEAELVGGKGCVCSRCHTARFCSRQCLEQCWKKQLHKGVCKRIAAARQQQQQQANMASVAV